MISLNAVVTSIALAGLVVTSSFGAEIGRTALVVVAVVDMRGEPLPTMKVDLRQLGRPVQTAETDSQGYAKMYLVPGSKFDLQVSHPGFATSGRKGLALEGKGPTVVGVALALPDTCPVDKKNKSALIICM